MAANWLSNENYALQIPAISHIYAHHIYPKMLAIYFILIIIPKVEHWNTELL